MLVDSHCHLNSREFINILPDIFSRLKQNHVGAVLSSCSTIDEFAAIIDIANNHENVYASIGIHPNEARPPLSSHELEEFFITNINNYKKIVCIGECGLDYHYNPGNDGKKSQIELLEVQLAIALKSGLPVMFHVRDASEHIHDIVTNFVNRGGTGVIHCFTGSYADAKKYLDRGLYISASGIITYKNADDLRKTFSAIPLDKLLVETDAPYLAPVPFRGRLNDPSYVPYTAEALAAIKGVSFEEIAIATTENFLRVYGLNLTYNYAQNPPRAVPQIVGQV